MTQATTFDRQAMEQALDVLGRRAHAEGKTVEIAIYGGSALMLTYDWRLATRDVDAVFKADREIVRQLAREIAEEKGWDPAWLNDGVKGFLSSVDESPQAKRLFRTYPSEHAPGLRVMVANPAYLFAMKWRATRLGGLGGSEDVDDIRRLAREIGLSTAKEALDLVATFYPDCIIEPRTQFGLEEIFDRFAPGSDPPGNGVSRS